MRRGYHSSGVSATPLIIWATGGTPDICSESLLELSKSIPGSLNNKFQVVGKNSIQEQRVTHRPEPPDQGGQDTQTGHNIGEGTVNDGLDSKNTDVVEALTNVSYCFRSSSLLLIEQKRNTFFSP